MPRCQLNMQYRRALFSPSWRVVYFLFLAHCEFGGLHILCLVVGFLTVLCLLDQCSLSSVGEIGSHIRLWNAVGLVC